MKLFEKVEDNWPVCFFLYFDYSDFDIQIGSEFLYLIDVLHLDDAIKINGKLSLVTQNLGLLYDQIPSGHKTICKVCFDKDSYKAIISKISVEDAWVIPKNKYLLSNVQKPDLLIK